MVDEDELERRVLTLGRLRRRPRGTDDHAVGGGERARGLQLRNAFELDEAHAARADGRAEPRLVTEDRDLDAGCEGGLYEARALRHVDLALVDRDADEIGHTPASCATGAR